MQFTIGLKKTALFAVACLFATFYHADSMKETSASTVTPENSLVTASNTQKEEGSSLYPIYVEKDGHILYGYIDGTGSVVINPKYTTARYFSDGLAVVNQDDSFLVINTKGKVILKTENYLNDFHNGLARFNDSKTYKSGYINTEGKIVIKATYDFAGNFGKDNTAIVSKSGKFYRINSKGKVLKTYSLTNKNYYYDITDDGYAIYTNTKTYLMGVKDLNGKTILKSSYSQITYLGNGLFGVKKKLSNTEGYLTSIKPSAIFDKNGKQLTPYKLYDLSVYNNNYASYTDSNYTYLIDRKGNKVASFPKQEGRGTLTVLGNVVQAEIDNILYYLTMDGSLIWKIPDVTTLSSGITVHTVKVKPNKYDVIYYPTLEGLSNPDIQTQINNKLKNLFTSDRMKLTTKDELMVDDNFTIEQIKDLLLVCKTGYDYPIGAAHGAPIRIYYFIDTKTGIFYEFKDLFKKNCNYINALDNIVREEMKEQEKKDGGIYFTYEGTYITEDQFFYLSNDTLKVYFDSGAIAPYAAGFPEFEIPFSKITNLIDTDGDFWKSFHE